MKPKKIARLIHEAVERHNALIRRTYRTLTVDFESKTISFDGGAPIEITSRCVSIPIRGTEDPLIAPVDRQSIQRFIEASRSELADAKAVGALIDSKLREWAAADDI